MCCTAVHLRSSSLNIMSLSDFEILKKKAHPVLTRIPDLIINERKRTRQLVDFAIPPNDSVNAEENEKLGKYQDLAKESKNSRNMNMTVLSVKVVAPGTIQKRLGVSSWCNG